MRRIYSPIDSENVALVKQTGRRDPIFHWQPHHRPETLMLGSVPDAQQFGSILSQFGFIWLGAVEFGC